MKYKKYRQKKQKSKLYVLFIIIISILILALCLDARIRPTVRKLATSQAVNLATIAVNNAIENVLEEENVTYDKLVTIKHTIDGSVTSVETNIVKVNTLKSKISKKCANDISKIQNKRLDISVGTLLGNEILASRGPDISLYVDLSGDVTTKIKNKFESAGINQTIHRIYLEITSNVFVVLAGSRMNKEIKTSVCIAETVIVGKVPNAYASLDGLKITQK